MEADLLTGGATGDRQGERVALEAGIAGNGLESGHEAARSLAGAGDRLLVEPEQGGQRGAGGGRAVVRAGRSGLDEIDGVVTSRDKLEAAVSFLDECISLPWYLELLDGPAFEVLVSLAVWYINETIGNDWNVSKIKQYFTDGKNFIQMITDILKLGRQDGNS